MHPVIEGLLVIGVFLGAYGFGLWGVWHRFGKKPVDKPAQSATMPVLERDAAMSDMSVYDKLMHKVDRDFAILSKEARDNIKGMIHHAMADGYNRGGEAHKGAAQQSN
jgi:hypothetical protein